MSSDVADQDQRSGVQRSLAFLDRFWTSQECEAPNGYTGSLENSQDRHGKLEFNKVSTRPRPTVERAVRSHEAALRSVS